MNCVETNYQFNLLYNQMTGVYHRIVKKYNLSECTFWILYALNVENRPLTQAELSAYLIAPKQTIHSSLHKMLEDDLLLLKETNGKKKYYALTKEGKKISKTTVQLLIKKEDQAFGCLNEKERDEFIRIFQKMLQYLEQYAKEEK